MNMIEGLKKASLGKSGHFLIVNDDLYFVNQERPKDKAFDLKIVGDKKYILYKEQASNFVLFPGMLIYVYMTSRDGLAMKLQDKFCKWLQSKNVDVTDAYDKRLDFVVNNKKMGAVIQTKIKNKHIIVMMINKSVGQDELYTIWEHCNGFKDFNYEGVCGLDEFGLYEDAIEFLEKDILI